jgi:hypothetical protein
MKVRIAHVCTRRAALRQYWFVTDPKCIWQVRAKDRFGAESSDPWSSALYREAPVLNDRWLEVNWVAGKPTPTIGSFRCKAEVRGEASRDSNGNKPVVPLCHRFAGTPLARNSGK